jgi:CRISPR-associated protein Csm2
MNMQNRQNRAGGSGGRRPPSRGQQSRADDEILRVKEQVPALMNPGQDIDGRILISQADVLGEYLARRSRMTTAQIRRIFTGVRKINSSNEEWAYELNLFKAQLAYVAGRFPNEVRPLQEVLDLAIEQVKGEPQRLHRFIDFFEAIVAYHKRYGGK